MKTTLNIALGIILGLYFVAENYLGFSITLIIGFLINLLFVVYDTLDYELRLKGKILEKDLEQKKKKTEKLYNKFKKHEI